MSNQQPLTSAQVGAAVKAFRSESCPACGVEKYRSLETFCEDCMRRLPPHLREGISDRSRYVELFHPALDFIKQNAVESKTAEPSTSHRPAPAGPEADAS